MNRKRWIWLGGLAIVAIVVLTLIMAPRSNPNLRGSTFSRAPDGYGAWFAYMQKQGVLVQRWQRPLKDFWNQPGATGQAKPPTTLLRVYSQLIPLESLSTPEEEWVSKGNTLVILGVRARATPANFRTVQSSPQGAVKIETTRREQTSEKLLGDRFGAIVWRKAIGNGQLILAATPHLAANAYQNEPGNFPFLAKLVRQTNNTIWVDEYMHGYRDTKTDAAQTETGARTWFRYLMNTPLLLPVIQVGVLLVILVWANNRRFGRPVPLKAVVVDNSEAYIQALAEVLYKANRHEFVLETISKEEQLQIQRALGLGETLLDPEVVIATWQQQTSHPDTEIRQVLKPQFKKQRAGEQDLQTWLETVRRVRQKLSEGENKAIPK